MCIIGSFASIDYAMKDMRKDSLDKNKCHNLPVLQLHGGQSDFTLLQSTTDELPASPCVEFVTDMKELFGFSPIVLVLLGRSQATVDITDFCGGAGITGREESVFTRWGRALPPVYI